MANKKAATKSARGNSKRTESDKQVDDPIIIKGGSITVQFEGDKKFKKDNGQAKNKFDHLDISRELTQLVVLRQDASGVYKVFKRVTLQKTDNVVICYTGSLCA
jgi:hypothetical protein